MTTVVLDSANLVESLTTGVIPVPAGIAEDNAAQAAKNGKEAPKEVKLAAPPKPDAKSDSSAPDSTDTAQAPGEPPADDVEGEDGLTPRQKREYTASMLKTVGKQHRLRREAEEREQAEYNQRQLAERRAEELQRENEELKKAGKPAIVEAKPPSRADFANDEAGANAYADALIDFRVDQKLAKQLKEQQAARESERQEQIKTQAAERIAHAIELVPDYAEVTEAADMIVPPVIAGYMQESDMFAELGYHLAKNPDILTKLQKMSPARSLVEIGKIESTLSPFASQAKANGTEPSQAPNGKSPSPETGSAPSKPRIAPIIRPLSAGSGAQVVKDESDMSQTEVIANFERTHGTKLTARKRH